MKNIYDGVAMFDAAGQATITLPDWFEALNGDFRYQLTPMGAAFDPYIAEEISSNQFTVAGGIPGKKVSWQVTGIRHDAFANANRIQVEERKPDAAVGTCTCTLRHLGGSRKMGVRWSLLLPDGRWRRIPTLQRRMMAQRRLRHAKPEFER